MALPLATSASPAQAGVAGRRGQDTPGGCV